MITTQQSATTSITEDPSVAPRMTLRWDPHLRSLLPPFYLKHGLGEKHMEAVYLVCHHLYAQRKYEEAYPLFQMMAFLDCYDKRAWLGVAACAEAMKLFSKAAGCYQIVAILDESDPISLLRSFNCYLECKKEKEAMMMLETALHRAEEQKERYSHLNDQIIKLKENLLSS